MKRKTPTLPRLLKVNKHGVTVYAVIVHLARGRRRVGFTREQIREVCGLGVRAIGRAIGALDEAGVIRRTYRRRSGKTLFSIVIPKDAFRFVFRWSKNRPPESRVEVKNKTSGNAKRPFSGGPKNDLSSLKRRSVVAASASATAATPQAAQPNSAGAAPEDTIAIIDALGLRNRGAS